MGRDPMARIKKTCEATLKVYDKSEDLMIGTDVEHEMKSINGFLCRNSLKAAVLRSFR